MNDIETIRFKKAIKNIKTKTQIGDNINHRSLSHSTIPPGSIDNKYDDNDIKNKSEIPQKNIVIVSQEEQDIHDDITTKYSLINDKLFELNKNIKLLDDANKENKMKINSIRTEMIKRLNYRFNELIKQSEAQILQKQNILNLYAQNLKIQQNKLYDAKLKYNIYLTDEGMNIKQRKQKIMELNTDIPCENIEKIDVIPKVKVCLNKDELLEFVDSVGNVRNYSTPTQPIITVGNVTPSTATVC